MQSLVARLAGAVALLSAALFCPALLAAEGAAPRRFAAPDVSASPPVSAAGGIGQVMIALVVVLLAVFIAAVLLKRLRNFSGGGTAGIEVLAQASVGPKERVVIVRVAGQRLLLGVATGQVSLLQTLEPDASLPPAAALPATPGFADLLRRSLGR